VKNLIQDTIAIVSSTGKLKPYLLSEIQEYYQNLGFKVLFGKSCFYPRKLTRPDDKFRAKELMDALENPSVKAIIFGRGGEYSERIIPYLNREIIKTNPKIVIGFSDVSSVLSYFIENSKSKVYHGLMATDVIMSGDNQTKMLVDILNNKLKKISLQDMTVIKTGECKGILKGGCISVLAKLFERDHSLSFDNCILFVEDINESVKSIANIFEKFKQSGKFIRLKGVLFGEMYNCAGGKTHNFWFDFMEVIEKYFFRYNIPVGYNVRSGHGRNEIYLPLGMEVKVKLTPKRSFLEIL
jgi:muramoyltetrapeptide carboxypeptidase